MMGEVIAKINRLTLLSQIAAVWCENHTKHINLMLTVTALLQFWKFTWSLMDTDFTHLRRNLHNSHAPDLQTQSVESFWHQDTGHTLKNRQGNFIPYSPTCYDNETVSKS
jgi:hypothetical protein